MKAALLKVNEAGPLRDAPTDIDLPRYIGRRTSLVLTCDVTGLMNDAVVCVVTSGCGNDRLPDGSPIEDVPPPE